MRVVNLVCQMLPMRSLLIREVVSAECFKVVLCTISRFQNRSQKYRSSKSSPDFAICLHGNSAVSEKMKLFQLRFFGHLARSAPEEDHHRVIAAVLQPPPDWRRPPGRPRSTWLRVIDEDVQPPNFGGPHGLEEGKGQGCLASSHQYGNALLGVHH